MQQDGSPAPLCTGGCGFYGRPEAGGLCSQCAAAAAPCPADTGGGVPSATPASDGLQDLGERQLKAVITCAHLAITARVQLPLTSAPDSHS